VIIDCDGCLARGPACQDCVVTVVLGPEVERHPATGQRGHRGWFPVPVLVSGPRLPVRGAGQVDLDAAEQAAIVVLAGSGLVPPLRAVPGPQPEVLPGAGEGPPQAGAESSVDRRRGSRPSTHAG